MVDALVTGLVTAGPVRAAVLPGSATSLSTTRLVATHTVATVLPETLRRKIARAVGTGVICARIPVILETYPVALMDAR